MRPSLNPPRSNKKKKERDVETSNRLQPRLKYYCLAILERAELKYFLTMSILPTMMAALLSSIP